MSSMPRTQRFRMMPARKTLQLSESVKVKTPLEGRMEREIRWQTKLRGPGDVGPSPGNV